LALPAGYVSGSALSATGMFDNTTLADLGLAVGVYNYTWGTGTSAGYLQFDIGRSVPEPASLPLIVAGLTALACVHRGRTPADRQNQGRSSRPGAAAVAPFGCENRAYQGDPYEASTA
jgi:hypothetical protein